MQQIYRITLLGRIITAAHRQEMQEVVQAAGLYILREREAVSRDGAFRSGEETDSGQQHNFYGRAFSLEKSEIFVQGEYPDSQLMWQRFLSMAAAGDIGIAVGKIKEEHAASDGEEIHGINWKTGIRLICFDMDSTLIRGELMDELGKYLGIGEQMQRLTALTMRGELDFNESFTRRVALLEGLEVPVLEKIMKNMPVAPGLERAMAALQKAGCKTAIVTGGFTVFGRYLQKKYGFDEVYTTDIEISDGKLTGRFGGPIIDGSRKAAALEELCRRENISVEQCAAVGDGANDIPMLTRAGLAIAYHSSGPDLYDLLETLECF